MIICVYYGNKFDMFISYKMPPSHYKYAKSALVANNYSLLI